MNKLTDYKFKMEKSFGLYLHIPFCEGKCRYCDFYSTSFDTAKFDDYLSSLKEEIKVYSSLLRSNALERLKLDTKEIVQDLNFGDNSLLSQIESIYIGGGTPGLLEPEQLYEILNLIIKYFSNPLSGEITLEANPYSLTEDKIADYRGLGVNRLSLGVQSFNEKELRFLGRKHTAGKAVEVINLIKKYFDNYNVDLIFAVPGQGIDDWRKTLKKAISFEPPHISLYNLQIEEGTPLAGALDAGEFQAVDDNMDAEMYLLARKMLADSGYQHYEISNFAKQGFQSRHNRIYWKLKPYLGLGPAAHSFTGKIRYNNYADLDKYNKILSDENYGKEKLPIDRVMELTQEDLMAEKLFMGLRLLEGILLEEFYNDFAVQLEDYYDDKIKKLRSMGLIEIAEKRIKLSEKGLLHGNSVFMEFLP